MKNSTQAKKFTARGAITAVVVCSLVLVAPVLSIVQIGRFFGSNLSFDSRSSAALSSMNARLVDQTDEPVQLFEQPYVTVTFDDGYESIYKTALPLLQKYGIHSTQYVLAGETDNKEYVSWKQISNMQTAGHEIGCHSMTHPNLTTLDDTNLQYQLAECKVEVTKHVGDVSSFASPYGAQNNRTLTAISKQYGSQRNTNGDPANGVSNVDINTRDNFNRFNIIGVTIHQDTTVAELKALVDYAKKTNGWVVLTYHQAEEGSGSQFGVDPKGMEAQFKYLSSTDVRIVTMGQAIAGAPTSTKAGE